MKSLFRAFAASLFFCVAGTLSAASICPSTQYTTSDCNFLITIGSGGMASVSAVPGSSAFNGPQTFADGTSDPGNDGSLLGVINNSSQPLTSFTLLGSGANAGIFDFSFNGICVYTNASYCSTASSGYEGPTTTFSNLKSTVLFQTTQGTVNFGPSLNAGMSTFFSIANNPADISAHGGLSVSNVALAGNAAAPEPANMALMVLGLGVLILSGRKLAARA